MNNLDHMIVCRSAKYNWLFGLTVQIISTIQINHHKTALIQLYQQSEKLVKLLIPKSLADLTRNLIGIIFYQISNIIA